ncbi:MAG TPA: hypothetical protein VGQ59_08310, partial [Cyclobacteriaceae bacterium]|nr:hypothetical protein [Cyclobacteriaceae bacterium]
MKTLYIISGVSRGLGKALVDKVILQNDSEVLAIGRGLSDNQLKYQTTLPTRFHFVELDLNKPHLISKNLSSKREIILAADRLIVISNAGTVNPIEKI